MYDGFFHHCHPEWTRPGVEGCVSLQGGLVKEPVVVKLDWDRQILFVQSRHNMKELLELINQNRRADWPSLPPKV